MRGNEKARPPLPHLSPLSRSLEDGLIWKYRCVFVYFPCCEKPTLTKNPHGIPTSHDAALCPYQTDFFTAGYLSKTKGFFHGKIEITFLLLFTLLPQGHLALKDEFYPIIITTSLCSPHDFFNKFKWIFNPHFKNRNDLFEKIFILSFYEKEGRIYGSRRSSIISRA